jgi:hypothetical protein
MAARNTHRDTVSDVPVADAQESLRLEVGALTAKLDLAVKQADSAKQVHAQELQRLQDLVAHLQRPSVLPKEPKTPREALRLIIEHLESVAVGGDALVLRQTVHTATVYLSNEDKQQVQEFATRLRAASEAVAQETSTLLL